VYDELPPKNEEDVES